MDYQFENLGEDRFQHFCQALLTAEFPDVQCFPIRQPDGGRDALTRFFSSAGTSTIVFQVKFVRRPQAVEDPWKWVTDTMEKELPKVEKLIPRGAEKYILLTNVPGTAHLDSGSIDKVHDLVSEHVSIPGQCWWRDDLNRRLDRLPDLRWAYSELVSGPDVLKMLLESGLQERLEQRMLALRAYLLDQFEQDKEVRFKQVELQNDLMDLFIDVPVVANTNSRKHHTRLWQFRHLTDRRRHFRDRDHFLELDEVDVGCAATLTDPNFQQEFPIVVIEGAPGQGKSTIAQFVCQLHRFRLLDKRTPDNLSGLYCNFCVRLPFKIDLRDFSAWLSGRNPFILNGDSDDDQATERTLETFLARQVSHHSGGATFSVSDLHSVFRASEVLLAFDGLDEIADLDRRAAVTKEVRRGLNRLTDLAAGLQCLITSRPSVFSESPAFPEDFLYLTLQSIRKPHIQSYATRWVRAKRLFGRDAKDVQRILDEKLDQPHLADLARNPMQLAILLSLILSRGASLPDKRTALYDSYMELFFSREAEKSSTVRDHRDLLLHIHGFLAWLLHAEAESKDSSGRVSNARLLELVTSFLESEGHDTNLAEELFAGMVERVVALVSRIEGTFEFEVQPLREYFAARYLYETAPYSPTGAEKHGTLPDRFDVIARNPFWLNVTRFYAGCFSKGELPSLVDRLEELVRAPIYKYTSYPRVLAAMLLGDWVFAQHPRSMRKVVDIVLDGVGRRYFTISEVRQARPNPALELPERSGRSELLEKCLQILAEMPSYDFAMSIVRLINANSTTEMRTERCLQALKQSEGAAFRTWLLYSLHLQVLGRLDTAKLQDIFRDSEVSNRELSILLRAGQHAFLYELPDGPDRCLGLVLDRGVVSAWRTPTEFPVELLSVCVNLLMSHEALAAKDNTPLFLTRSVRPMYDVVQTDYDEEQVASAPEALIPIYRFAKVIAEQTQLPQRQWAISVAPWSAVVENGRYQFGDRWAFCEIANVSAGITSKSEKGVGFEDFFDKALPLCERVRHARLKSGSPKWWRQALTTESGTLEKKTALLVLHTWATARTIRANSDVIQKCIEQLPALDWFALHSALRRSRHCLQPTHNTPLSIKPDDVSSDISEKLVGAIWSRLSHASKHEFYLSHIKGYDGNDRYIHGIAQSYVLANIRTGKVDWQEALSTVSTSYRIAGNADPAATHRFARNRYAAALSETDAQGILDRPSDFPTDLVAHAERVCARRLSDGTRAVLDTATKQKWFESQ